MVNKIKKDKKARGKAKAKAVALASVKTQTENLEPVSYTKDERNVKVTKILTQLMQIQMDHVITDEIRGKLFNFINTGESYITEIELPQYSRVLQINFVDDKNRDKENSINLVFKKIRIEGEGDDNPINKLNKLQEDMFQF